MKKLVSLWTLVCLLTVQTPFMASPFVHAQDGEYVNTPLRLPKPGTMVHLSQPMNPPILKGIKVHPDDPFRFDFILDRGNNDVTLSEAKGLKGSLDPSAKKQPQDDKVLKQEANRLIKYFLASITIPEGDLWVNLSPYEKDRIVPTSFGQTEMGRDLLAQDYMLKQITASLIYPEDEMGKKFWKRIYEEAQAKYGTTNIPVNTFNKVWIVPEKAVVYENSIKNEPLHDDGGHMAYVVESRLKVMLEVDYLAMSKNIVGAGPRPALYGTGSAQRPGAGLEPARTDVNQLGSQIVREIVIPALTREINEGANFAQLRQVYNSLILATWYKKKIKESILAKVYADQNKVAGISIHDVGAGPRPASFAGGTPHTRAGLGPARTILDVESIYHQYLSAFKKGAYNYIKEEPDPSSGQAIPRKYFSGGASMTILNAAMTVVKNIEARHLLGDYLEVLADFKPVDRPPEANSAMTTDQGTIEEYYAERLESLVEVPWAELPAISKLILQWSRDKDFFFLMEGLNDGKATRFFTEYLPQLEGLIQTKNDWDHLYPFLKNTVLKLNSEKMDSLLKVVLPKMKALWGDQLSPEHTFLFGSLLAQRVSLERFTRLNQILDQQDMSGAIAYLQGLPEESPEIKDLMIFTGSRMSLNDMTTTITHYPLNEMDRYALLTGFHITHTVLEDRFYQDFKKHRQNLSSEYLGLALGNSQNLESLECLSLLWDAMGLDRYKTKNELFSSVIQNWPIGILYQAFSDSSRNLSFGLMIFIIGERFQDFEVKRLEQMQFKLKKYSQISEVFSLLVKIPNDPVFFPFIEHVFQSITTAFVFSRNYGTKIDIGEIENLYDGSDAYIDLLRHFPHLTHNREFRRMISVLPLGFHNVGHVKNLIDSLSVEVGYGGFIGRLRENIHNNSSTQDLRLLRLYDAYLDRGDGTGLKEIGEEIPETDPGSFRNLDTQERLKQMQEKVKELIREMEIIYNGVGAGFDQIITEYELRYHTRDTGLKDLLESTKPLDEILSRPIVPSSIVNGLRLAADFKKNIDDYSRNVKPNNRFLIVLLEAGMETYVFRLVSELESRPLNNRDLISVVGSLIDLLIADFDMGEQEELKVIREELLEETTLNPLRTFSILQRINRVLIEYSKKTSQTYQVLAETQAQGQTIYNRAGLGNFSAILIREETIFQLSRVAQNFQSIVAGSLGLSWIIVRPGVAQGQLLHVPNTDQLQTTIDQLSQPTILITDRIPNQIVLNSHVRAVVTKEEQGTLSHTAINSDHDTSVVLVQAIGKRYEGLVGQAKQSSGAFFEVKTDDRNMTLRTIKALNGEGLKIAPMAAVEVLQANLTIRGLIVNSDDYRPETVGNKAESLKRQEQWIKVLQQKQKIPSNFDLSVPKSVALPFGYFELLLDSNGEIGTSIRRLRTELQNSYDDKNSLALLQRINEWIGQLQVDESVMDQIMAELGEKFCMVRLSTNAEDLPKYAAAGVYASFEGVSRQELAKYMKKAYASLYSPKAFRERRSHLIDETRVHAAIIFQKMVPSEHSFVVFTQDPTLPKEQALHNSSIELVLGLGRGLVSGEIPGSPHRFRYNHQTSVMSRHAYANKSYMFRTSDDGGLEKVLNDYRTDTLSQTPEPEWVKSLLDLILEMSREMNNGRDMEGAVIAQNGRYHIFMLQDRNQTAFDQAPSGDNAQLSAKWQNGVMSPNKGGIDFNSNRMNLQTRNEGKEVKFNVDPTQLKQFEPIAGFTPVIIHIAPMLNLRLFLGLKESNP